jgi:serine/threonine protein kinase
LLATHANCLPVGTVIADFEVVGLVGEGGFGIVYLARDVNLDRVVAVKEFMPSAFAGRVDGIQVAVRSVNHRATYEAGLRSFINEAKMLAKFAHPALVEVYRFWEGNGTAYMAMRYYAGETLRQHLTHGKTVFDEESIAQTMAPIFDALEMLHREQVFHRDIAPDNIMLADGRPVLLDFGSARRIIGDGTQALTTILKPGYAPIEQYVDDGTMKQGPWTDVYALGGVLYHLATGKAPLQAVSRLLSDPLQTVNEVTGNKFSPTFSAAVAKAMAVRVEERLQNVREFSEMLGWNTAKPTRVMTLPNASHAGHTAERVDPTLSPEPVVPAPVFSAPPKPDATLKASQSLGNSFPDISTHGEQPAHRPEEPPKKSVMVPLVTVVVAVVAIAYFLLSRPTAPTVASSASAPVSTSTLVAKQESVHVPAVTVTVGQNAASKPVAVLETGLVKLNISPWGTVVVDGVTKGVSDASKLRQIVLTTGTHTIEIAKPDAPTLKQTIEVSATTPLTISHSFK